MISKTNFLTGKGEESKNCEGEGLKEKEKKSQK